MKKLLIIFAIALLTGCSTPYQLVTSTVSFEKYTKAGFLITTSSVSVPYQSLGMVSIDCVPGVEKVSSNPMIFEAGTYHDCNADGLISELYKQALKLNANALIDVKFSNSWINTSKKPQIIHSVTGLAVKIGN